MNWVTIITDTLLTIHIIVSLFLILIILMQRPRSEGLGTAFGSAVTDTLFGSGAGNVLTKITTWFAVLLFATTLSLAYIYSHHRPTRTGLGEKLKASEQNVTPPPVLPFTNAAPSHVTLEATNAISPSAITTNSVVTKPISSATSPSLKTDKRPVEKNTTESKPTEKAKKKDPSSKK